MIGDPTTGTLTHCEISAVSHEGLSITTADGKRGTLAVLDENGNIIETGPSVAFEAWNVAVLSYRNFLKGKGYLRVRSSTSAPPKS